MVENLLTLARADANQLKPACEPVDATELMRELWSDCAAAAAGRKIDTTWKIDAPVVVASDPGLLRVVLRNLLENAVSTRPGRRTD